MRAGRFAGMLLSTSLWVASPSVAIFGTSPRAEAQDVARVVVLEGDAPNVETSLLGELAAVELPAVRGPRAEIVDPSALEALARTLEADVLVTLRRTERGLEVWVLDRITQKLVLRVLAVNDDDARAAALQVLELVRASFLEVRSVAFDAGELPAPVVALAVAALPEPSAAPTSSRFASVRVAGALSFAPGGLGAGAHVEAEVALRLDGPLELDLWALAPTVPLVVRDDEGSARTRIVAVGVGTHAHVVPASSFVDVRLGVRLGLLHLRVEGTASPPLEGRTSTVRSAWLGLDARIAFWVCEWLALDLTIDGFVAWPKPSIVFVERSVATWGMPAFIASVGLTAKIGA